MRGILSSARSVGSKRLVGVVVMTFVLAACNVNTLWDNWSGQPSYSQDTNFSPPDHVCVAPATGCPTHSEWVMHGNLPAHEESATAFFNGTWFMYNRESVDYTQNHVRYEIAVSTSTDGGMTWAYHNVAIPFGSSVGCGTVESPKVLVQLVDGSPLMTMVYEANPTFIDSNGANLCSPEIGPNGTALQQYIAIAYSGDGYNFVFNHRIITPEQSWEGWNGSSYVGAVGTPTILQVPGGYEIGYHGFSGTNGANSLRRGSVLANVADTRSITEAELDPNRPANPDVFTSQNGGALNPAYYGVGEGAADIIRLTGSAGGTNDGGYYMVFEGFSNYAVCSGDPSIAPRILTAIARSSNPNGPWAVQDHVLYGGHTGCGVSDLPSWMYDPSRHCYLVTWAYTPAGQPMNHPTTLRRIILSNAEAPPPNQCS
jgi:hypothetical protein